MFCLVAFLALLDLRTCVCTVLMLHFIEFVNNNNYNLLIINATSKFALIILPLRQLDAITIRVIAVESVGGVVMR